MKLQKKLKKKIFTNLKCDFSKNCDQFVFLLLFFSKQKIVFQCCNHHSVGLDLVARTCWRLSKLFHGLIVDRPDFEHARNAVIDVVGLGKLLQAWHNGGVVVARHGREQVVDQLKLHATPKIVPELAVCVHITSRNELVLDKFMVDVIKIFLALQKK